MEEERESRSSASSPIFLLVTDVSDGCVTFAPIETLPDKLCEQRWKERPKAQTREMNVMEEGR
jgi:hypothetical protein